MEQILSNIIFVPLLIALILGLSRASLRWIRLGAAASSSDRYGIGDRCDPLLRPFRGYAVRPY